MTQPSVISCARTLGFDAGHRVAGHEGNCKHVHGHRYTVEATFMARELDGVGRVVDFGAVKKLLGAWLEARWDHTLILWENDRALGEAVAAHTGQEIFYLPYNPTAENLARYLLEDVCPALFAATGVRCVAIRVHETPNCYAEARVG